MSIERRLRAASEQIKGLTVWRTTKNQWQVGLTIDGHSWAVEIDDDMPTALNRLTLRWHTADAEGAAAGARSALTDMIEDMLR